MSNPEEGSYRRPILEALLTRLREQRRFLQVLAGPRQSGKSTLVRQAALALGIPTLYRSADEATLRGPGWIAETSESLSLQAKSAGC